MDPGSEIGQWLHITFGIAKLSSSEVNDCFIEVLMSIQPLSEKNS